MQRKQLSLGIGSLRVRERLGCVARGSRVVRAWFARDVWPQQGLGGLGGAPESKNPNIAACVEQADILRCVLTCIFSFWCARGSRVVCMTKRKG